MKQPVKSSKQVTCKICNLQEHTDNKDLDDSVHMGFTIGNGNTLYWAMVWHPISGNVTVYNATKWSSWRYLSGDQLITIHWK